MKQQNYKHINLKKYTQEALSMENHAIKSKAVIDRLDNGLIQI